MRKSFTMLELIFVIVVIGILAGVAIPRLFSGVSDAEIAKVKTDVATIRTAISTKYGKNVMEGNDVCPTLETSTTDGQLFEGILTYPIKQNSGTVKWDGNGTDYNVSLDGGNTVITFHYDNNTSNNCKFSCVSGCSVIGE
ncbi:ABC transporter permease [Nautilia sp. PV-1]|uniref:type II secretion system protein n=1 Tax=Nautilia sp. PV-1 TaxID=2579250 RepID=UPI000FDBC107|nr:prepilin-type N-terminal cleavage/methylation domain-containing protein [Nautilia sp. PV-1]AZV46803.1 ABC transporter permease [Nautilia sp. PV-1]